MNKDELKERTKQFALRIIKLINELPNSKTGNVIGNQLVRSATSAAANYRAACRAKSKADFIYKINIVEEDSDESLFWLELIQDASLLPKERLEKIILEASELTAIFTATGKSAKISNRKSE